MAWIVRGPGGSHQVHWRDPAGRHRSQTFSRRRTADAFLRDLEVSMDRGNYIDPAAGKITFSKWSETWIGLQAGLKPKTLEGYRNIIRTRLEPVFGQRPLSSITPEEISTFIAEQVESGAMPWTIRNTYFCLSGIFRSAVKHRRISASPCVDVTLPRPTKRDMLILTSAEIAQLGRAIGQESAPIVYLGAYGGLRFGEIAALRGGRVDALHARVEIAESLSEANREVHFVAPKTGERRTVTIPRFVAEALPIRGPSELLFTAPDRGPLRHARFLRRVFRPAVRAAGLPRELRFHDLRHSCASLMIAQGAHPLAVKEQLGHSTIRTTMDIYGHLFPAERERLADALDAAHRQAIAQPLHNGPPALAGRARSS